MRHRGFLDPGRLLNAPQFSNLPRGPAGEPSALSITPLGGGMGNQMEGSSVTQVLWGTSINTNAIQTDLKEFLLTYRKPRDDSMGDDFNDLNNYQEDKPYYIQLLESIKDTEEYFLEVDCSHLAAFNIKIYRQLENYPTDVIPIFDLVAMQVYKEVVLSSL